MVLTSPSRSVPGRTQKKTSNQERKAIDPPKSQSGVVWRTNNNNSNNKRHHKSSWWYSIAYNTIHKSTYLMIGRMSRLDFFGPVKTTTQLMTTKTKKNKCISSPSSSECSTIIIRYLRNTGTNIFHFTIIHKTHQQVMRPTNAHTNRSPLWEQQRKINHRSDVVVKSREKDDGPRAESHHSE